MRNGARILTLLFGVLIINSLACKKSGNNIPPVDDTAIKQLATKIATGAYGLLYPYGGYTIFHPANPPYYPDKPIGYTWFASPKPDSAGSCGFNVDTTMSYSDTSYAIFNINGASHFNIICNGSVVSGYKVRDTLTYIFPNLPTGTSYTGQNLTITLVTSGNISSLIVDGSINLNNSRSPDKPGGPTITETASYTYSSVKANLKTTNYDLASGSATFTDIGVDDSGKWNYSGTVLFLGDYKAKVTISGSTYTVDIPNQQEQ